MGLAGGTAINQLARGALSGAVATVPMTVVILGGRTLAGFRTPPPVEITHRISQRAGLPSPRSEGGFRLFWLTGHIGYGAGCGVLYVLVRRWLPRAPVPAGLIAGGAVWGVSYLGYLPALSLYPSPEEDSRDRTLVMIAAHAVYGVALAMIERLVCERFPDRS